MRVLESIDTVVSKFPLSTAGSVALSVNWGVLTPVFLQLGLFVVDLLRQKFIKKQKREKPVISESDLEK
ncbi:hypothetical protein KRE43_05545 [Elizabethkingia meningoseptica]|uniref:hypothetical protein n=1 Tax=Elizabethkingia meningoseptica TaxID=238 RepID=UPI000841914E|nr:hypothetical protein [Elizabethkingia meningoseptica]MDE5529417.1 hypothetical protein [Elizabethkingia meningoseptica]MDE5532973.1 hypothetical protein [Elizabethkingia meningoseptica]MDE5541306.1 hypothetical protein [Elizabethkingia meningoseptica]MDN4032973.1 hypothetical protein [Elizabethkingia meningoseptica]ODM54331.1 hypothetical protein BES09_09065 [Elizabethkingia meningoseptica]